MGTFNSNLVQGVVRFTNRSLIKNLIVITLIITFFFVQLFYPYEYYSSASRKPDSSFQVGVHYVFEQDELGRISSEVNRIHDLGFKAIRITLECNPNDDDDVQNQKNDAFFNAASADGIAVALVIPNLDTPDKVDYYLNRWGGYLAYIQVMNEPELSSTWSAGALFTDDEIISKFDLVYNTVESHSLSAQLYTNFGIGYLIRSNIPIDLSKKLDFVGLDIFMDSFLVLSPLIIPNLQKITDKNVVITEFGMSTTDSAAQTNYIIKGLNLFKSMGLTGCWLVYWNSAYDSYGIRDKSTEQAVGEWIAQNAS
jgi:hypothetical protein